MASMYLNYLLIWILCVLSIYINSHLFLLYYTHAYVERSNHAAFTQNNQIHCVILRTELRDPCTLDYHSFFSLLNHSNTFLWERFTEFPIISISSFLSSTWATKLSFFFLSFLKLHLFICSFIYLMSVGCVWESVFEWMCVSVWKSEDSL